MLALTPICVEANPQGGVVVGGSATFAESGTKLDVHQHSHKAIIDWRSFDIEVGEYTQFHQPSSSAIALNRVNDVNPSQVLGDLSANGNIVIVNPNGVFFGPNSRVDVNGLLATSTDIDNDDFMAGRYVFDKPGSTHASIVNEGLITAKEAGLVGLVAPNVINSGIINAKLGRVELASGDSVSVDFYGDGLIELKVSDDVKSQLIGHSGEINAEGGAVAMTAAAGRDVVDSLIYIDGEIKAPTIAQQGGKIIIAAEGSNAIIGNIAEEKGLKEGSSKVILSGALLDASGVGEGEQGGEISVLADEVYVQNGSLLNASGHSAKDYDASLEGTATLTADKGVRSESDFLNHQNRAGGSIKIGGDYLGQGSTAAANYVEVSNESYLLTDAIGLGDGGRTIVWSDDETKYYGQVYGRGGLLGGHGGFLETSGKNSLIAGGYANLTAESGYLKGKYLLDPSSITVAGGVDTVFTSADLIHYWDYEEGTGTTVSDQTGSVDGSNPDAGYSTDIANKGYGEYSLDMTNDQVDYGDIDAVEQSQVTYSFWAKSDETNKDQGFVYKGNHSTSQPLLIWRDDSVGSGSDSGNKNAISVLVYDGTNQDWYATPTDSFNDNDWHHIAVTIDPVTNNQIEIYIDGVNLRTGAMTSSGIQAGWSSLTSGRASSGGTGLTGHMDDLRIYNSVLSASDIAELSANTFTVKGIEWMSQTSDVHLLADNEINFDFNSEQLDMQAGRDVTFETTNGDINVLSNSSILTEKQSGVGGDINLIAGGAGNIVTNADLTLHAQNGGSVNLTAGGGQFVNNNANWSLVGDSINLNGVFTGSDNGAFSIRADANDKTIGVGTGGTHDIMLSDADVTDIQSAFGMYTFGGAASDDVTNYQETWEDQVSFLTAQTFTNEVDVTSDDKIIVEAADKVVLNGSLATTSALANALYVQAENVFENNVGANALSAVNDRWIVYSKNPTENTRNGLLPDASIYGDTLATLAVGAVPAGNHFVYSDTTRPGLVFNVQDVSVEYGDTFLGSVLNYNSGLLSGDTLLNISLTGTHNTVTTYTAGTNAGNYIGGLTASAGSMFNALGYTYTFNAGDIDVTKATLITALAETDYEITAEDVLPDFDVVYSGFKLGETDAVIDTHAVADTGTDGKSAGVYDVNITGGLDNNYVVTPLISAGKLTVLEKPASALPSSVEVVSQEPVALTGAVEKIQTPVQQSQSQNNQSSNSVGVVVDVADVNGGGNVGGQILGGLIEIHPDVVESFGLATISNQFEVADQWREENRFKGFE